MLKCTKCGAELSSPSIKCPRCFATGTLVTVEPKQKMLRETVTEKVQKRIPSGFGNIDKILGGGMVTGGVHFLVALPGTCKTTLLFQVAAYLRKNGFTVFFFTGEETPELVKARALRMGITEYQPEIFYRKEIRELEEIVRRALPDVLIIDSLQSILGTQTVRLTNEAQTSLILRIRKLTDIHFCVTWVIGQVTKEGKFAGPEALAHYSDVCFEAKRGLNDEVIISTPTKNRYGSTNLRAVFRMTGAGLIEKDEKETSYILRHLATPTAGLAAFMATTPHGLTVDEITAVENGKDTLLLVGGSKAQSSYLKTVIQNYFAEFEPGFIIRANLTEKFPKSADLAIVMALLSKYYDKPLPLDTAFIASIDATGRLLPVDEMGMMVERAKGQGYSRVFGAMPIGSQTATWETANTIKDVWNLMGF